MQMTFDLAQAIIDAALKSSRRQQVLPAIVVVDQDGRVMASARDHNAGSVILEAATRKATAAATFGTSTQAMRKNIGDDGEAIDAVISNPELSLLPGGVPIIRDGKLCGAVGVAGGHYSQDETVAVEAVAALSRSASAPGSRTRKSNDEPREFDGKNVIVTGAMGGIGLVACELFARRGAKVLGFDLQADHKGARAAEYRAQGLDISFAQLDVGDPVAIAEVGPSLAQMLGHVDILINNAGVLSFGPLLQAAAAEWDRVQSINCRSVFLMTQAVAPLMAGEGVILNMSSSAALSPTANTAAYSVAKMGIITFSKIAALELGPGIRVNAVCPGPLDTAMPRNYLRGHPKEQEIMDSMINRTIVKRLGQASEIAELLVFLASDKAAFITGSVITADGGYIA